MSKVKLGDWRWYLGTDEQDDEMMDCGTREHAIADGRRQFKKGQPFYIVEARMRVSDEKAMERGEADSALFEESRNGEWITA